MDGDSEDVVCELPHLDTLLWLDGDGDGSKAQDRDLGLTGLDLGSTIFLFFVNQFFVSVNVNNRHHKCNFRCRCIPTGIING
jgi:hypothetical protein